MEVLYFIFIFDVFFFFLDINCFVGIMDVNGKLYSSSITNCIFIGIYSLCEICYGGVLCLDTSNYLNFIIDSCIFSKGNVTQGTFIYNVYGFFRIFRTRFEDDLLVGGHSLYTSIPCIIM
jgi:hypothetical protein